MIKIRVVVLTVTILLCFFIFSFTVENIRATDENTIFIDDNYDNSTYGFGVNHFNQIQSAINAASVGNTLYVYSGVYYENLLINKSISIVGEDKTIVDGGGNGDVITIKADKVFINNFSIQNSGHSGQDSGLKILSGQNIIQKNNFDDNQIGILIRNSKSNFVSGNNITNNTYGIGVEFCKNKNDIYKNYVFNNKITGIYLSYSDNNLVNQNYIENNSYGIALSFCNNTRILENNNKKNNNYGLSLYSCSNNRLVGNRITESNHGIVFEESNFNNTIDNNNIKNYSFGIRIGNKNKNTTITNNIISNGDNGIYISAKSKENHIFNNIFSNNEIKIQEETTSIEKEIDFLYVLVPSFIIMLIIMLYGLYKILQKKMS